MRWNDMLRSVEEHLDDGLSYYVDYIDEFMIQRSVTIMNIPTDICESEITCMLTQEDIFALK